MLRSTRKNPHSLASVTSRIRLAAISAALPLALAACANGIQDPELTNVIDEARRVQTEIGIAPDAARPDPAYEGFLDKVQKNCPLARIGSHSIRWELLQDPSFLDLTSRFYNGIISQQKYIDTLTGYYNAPASSPGIRCILDQLPKQ